MKKNGYKSKLKFFLYGEIKKSRIDKTPAIENPINKITMKKKKFFLKIKIFSLKFFLELKLSNKYKFDPKVRKEARIK